VVGRWVQKVCFIPVRIFVQNELDLIGDFELVLDFLQVGLPRAAGMEGRGGGGRRRRRRNDRKEGRAWKEGRGRKE
jgi:hypothetical protein